LFIQGPVQVVIGLVLLKKANAIPHGRAFQQGVPDMQLYFTVNAQNPHVQRCFPGICQLFNQNIVLSWQEIVQDYATRYGSGLCAPHRYEEELAWTILRLVQNEFLHILPNDHNSRPGVHIYRCAPPHALPADASTAQLFKTVLSQVLTPGQTMEFEQLWEKCRGFLIQFPPQTPIAFDEKILAYSLIKLAQADVIRLS